MPAMSIIARAFALIALLLVGHFAAAQTTQPETAQPARLTSPDGALEITVWTDAATGRPMYRVDRQGLAVIAPSRLGLRFLEGADLTEGFTAAVGATQTSDTRWDQPWGERRTVRDHHAEFLVTFTAAADPETRFGLRVRAFNDGVAFRYEVPADPANPSRRLIDEETQFAFAETRTAWWIPAGEWNRYEYLYRTTPLADAYRVHTPFTLELTSGLFVAIHEAALVDYSGMWLVQNRPGIFEADLAPAAEGYKARLDGAFITPWRTIQVSPRAVGLANSDIILNLNEPNALGDVSFVKPSKYIGIWWCMHINACTWGSGDIHGATTDRTKAYIDFAAANGFDGVLVEGWNTGWDGDWFNNGAVFSFTQAYPDFDIEALATYARERGVYLIGHHETSGDTLNYEAQLDAALDLYARLGIPSIKTGYVADGGDLVVATADGRRALGWHDGQESVRHHIRVLRAAAARGISINAHEPVKDTGLRRTYPNWLSREGARGQEYNAWGQPPNPPEHTTILPFTRMLSGPMDFTPGIFDLSFGKPLSSPTRVQTTLAKQLALYVVLYSPVQMAADLPENYLARPDAFEFIKAVPVDWDRSIAIDGYPGEFVAIARRDRNGPDWYVGAVTDENARTVSIPLDFLEREGNWTATIYADGPGADWDTNPYAFVRESRTVTNRTVLNLVLAPGGGAAVRLSPTSAPQDGPLRPPLAAAGVGELLNIKDFPATGLISRDIQIWLPPGYAGGTERYPVLYMHDGQNLFEPGNAFGGKEWQVDETMNRLIAAGTIRPAIVVGISNSSNRWREYVPQAVVDRLPEGLREEIAANQGEILTDTYLAFLTGELKPYIDSAYRTLPDRENTMIAGSSMGGLVSLYAVAQYPDVFGSAAGISTHWPLVVPESVSPDIVLPAVQDYLAASGLSADKHRLWFDHGTLGLDAGYGPYQEQMDVWFAGRGFTDPARFSTAVYEGTDHNEASWAARLPDILTFLLGR